MRSLAPMYRKKPAKTARMAARALFETEIKKVIRLLLPSSQKKKGII